MDMIPIPSQTAGPFFHLGCTGPGSAASLASDAAKGEHIRLTCRVFDGDNMPVGDAMIELWQANSEGKYQHAADAQTKPIDPAFSGFGRLATDNNGSCIFNTVKPGCVPGPANTVQAPHINVSVFARGILNRLATRIYFAGDPTNREDPILALAPVERRSTLMAQLTGQGEWSFDIHLCGERETVFFDV